MKLLSYYVENFGAMKGVSGSFLGGLNCVCERNGFGKSTLTSFIRVMFYGMKTWGARDREFCDREHYFPFSGGKFGGNLTFEYKGKTYKIERFFDEKSQTKDTLKVLCGGEETNEFGEDIGFAVFGVDEEAFERTLLVGAGNVEVSANHSISEKLGGEFALGKGDFERALKKLDDRRVELKPKTKKGGVIFRLESEIKDLKIRLDDLTRQQKTLPPLQEEVFKKSQEVFKAEQEEKKRGERRLVQQRWATYDGILARAKAAQDEAREIVGAYNGVLPTEQDVKLLEDGQSRLRELDSEKKGCLALENTQELERLERLFGQGVPTEQELLNAQELLREHDGLAAEIKRLKNEQDISLLNGLESKYAAFNAQAELPQIKAVAEEYARTQKSLADGSFAAPVKKKSKIFGVLAAVCLVLIAVGVGVCFVQKTAGIAVVAAAAIALLCDGFFYLKGNMTAPVSAQQNELRAKLSYQEGQLQAFAMRFFGAGEEPLTAISAVEGELARLQELRAQMKKANELELAAKQTFGLLTAFLTRYQKQGLEPFDGLQSLRADATLYRRLVQAEGARRQTLERIEKEFDKEMTAVREIAAKYPPKPRLGELICALRDDLQAYKARCKAAQDAAVEAENYKRAQNLTERVQAVEESGEDVNLLRGELERLKRRLADLEYEVEGIAPVKEQIFALEEKLAAAKDEYALISTTTEYLQAAEKRVRDKFVAPVLGRFSSYAAALEKALGERVEMTTEYKVLFERGGQTRREEHLSAGERTLLALCVRLALIDNMYKAEQPFVVLDDPFVHLDETHLQKTKKLIAELAGGRQILYFCCHESRKL